MSMVCYPFDSIISGYDDEDNPIYDRAANSQVMADWMRHYFSNGVFGNETTGSYGFGVTTAAAGMNIIVSPGACNIQGRFGYEEGSTTLTLDDASSTYDRVDAVILRLNLETDVRSIYVGVIKGTPSDRPVAPVLQRDSTIYDLKIAEVTVKRGVTSIAQAYIKDTRLNTTDCGLVAVPMKTFDTDDLYQQLEAALTQITVTDEAEFQEWFDHIREILDDNVAGHLQNEIDDLSDVLDTTAAATNARINKTLHDAIEVTLPNVSSSARTFNVTGITADHELVQNGVAYLSNPAAAGSDLTLTTANGKITVGGTLSGTTNITATFCIKETKATGAT